VTSAKTSKESIPDTSSVRSSQSDGVDDKGLPSEGEWDSMSYEELVGTLEELTGRMASGDVGIEEATDLYEKATAVHRIATLRLETIRQRIETLEEFSGSGSTE
jgi:exodeoxyribonuclease VII small subunit